MNLTISGHHLEVTQALREYVLNKLSRVLRHFDQVVDVNVLLTVEKQKEKERRQRAEVTLHVKGRDIFVEQSHEDLYAAIARHYEFRILNRRAPAALDANRVWQVVAPLDAARMHEAAQTALGKHDFTTFRAAECQAKSPVKTLDRLNVAREGETVIVRASARSFLHSQVRSMTGSLKLVGEGKWSVGDFKSALDAADRSRCGPLAPPSGLYLVRVDY